MPGVKEGELVVTRFPPEPNGFLHIGHAKALFLNYEAANTYRGRMLLRFDDTNPEKEGSEYVEGILRDIEWLCIRHSKPTFTSDSMDKLYGYCEKLIAAQRAYACTCEPEAVKKNRMARVACGCRKRGAGESLAIFKGMQAKGGIGAGKAVIRFAGDMGSENTTMRDPVLFRIIEARHFRQGDRYRAWPNYDFVAPVMDSLEGVTHAMRSKEYELRDELYAQLQRALGLKPVGIAGFSRLDILGVPVSKREIRKLIEDGTVGGWDDPRLVTIAALRRRGITPQAIREFVLSFGLSKVESTPNLAKLLALNRKIIDPDAKRYYFARGNKTLEIANAVQQEVELKSHPSGRLGTRKLAAKGEFYIDENDFAAINEGDTVRLKDFCAVRVVGKDEKGIIEAELIGENARLEDMKTSASARQDFRIIQWVPKESALKCRVLVPSELFDGQMLNENSLAVDEGHAELNCGAIRQGEHAQFERYGFVVPDGAGKDEEGRLIFIQSHK